MVEYNGKCSRFVKLCDNKLAAHGEKKPAIARSNESREKKKKRKTIHRIFGAAAKPDQV